MYVGSATLTPWSVSFASGSFSVVVWGCQEAAEPPAPRARQPFKMTGINTTQPSPFGHLTRERHIESISKPLGRKHNSLELLAGQLSCGHRHTLLAIESGIGATQRSSPRPTAAIKDGVASTGVPRCCNCNAEPWAGSEMSTAGEKGQVIQALPSMVPGCKGRQESPLRPTQEGLKATEQQVRQENTAMHPGLRILSGIQWLRITARAELHGKGQCFMASLLSHHK